MGKSNVANHSLRLNLDNEQHRRVEKVLAGLNLDVHKSINQFLVEAADSYIRRLEGTDLLYEDVMKKADSPYITKAELDKAKGEIKDELQREMISILASSLLAGKVAQKPETKTVMEVSEEREETADETMMGLASSWG